MRESERERERERDLPAGLVDIAVLDGFDGAVTILKENFETHINI